MLGASIILLSFGLLLYVKKNYVARKARLGFLTVIMAGLAMLGGTTLWAQEALDITPGEILATILPKKVGTLRTTNQFKIDPIGDGDDVEYNPITGEDKHDPLEMEGDKGKQEKKDTPKETTQQPNNTSTRSGAVNSNRGGLVSTGENPWGYLIGILLVLGSGLLGIYVMNKQKRNKKEKMKHVK